MSDELEQVPEGSRQMYRGRGGSKKALEATNAAIRSAVTSGQLTPHDEGGVEIARMLARRMDQEELSAKLYWEYLDQGRDVEDIKPMVQRDNTLTPTYLKVLEHLGLTPRSRAYINSVAPKTHVASSGGSESSEGVTSKVARFKRG